MEKKTFKRIHRDSRLTSEQAARDQEIRQKLQEEFPPLVRVQVLPVLSDPLKKAITESPKSVEQLAREAGVSAALVRRFLAGEGDLRLAAADHLAQILGLKLVAS